MRSTIISALALFYITLPGCAEAQDNRIPDIRQPLIAENQIRDGVIPKPLLQETLWQNRLLIICSTNIEAKDPMLARIDAEIDWAAFFERDLILVDVDPEDAIGFVLATQESGRLARISVAYKAERDAIADLARCQSDRDSIALIGKDGGLKKRWLDVPHMSDIYALIDAMPMRQQEMRRQDKASKR